MVKGYRKDAVYNIGPKQNGQLNVRQKMCNQYSYRIKSETIRSFDTVSYTSCLSQGTMPPTQCKVQGDHATARSIAGMEWIE